MSPKISRLLLLASMAAGFGVLPMSGARADSAIVGYDLPTGFSQLKNAQGQPIPGQCKNTTDPNQMPNLTIGVGQTVSWYMDGGNQDKHNVSPATDVAGAQKWPVGKSPDIAPGDPKSWDVKFDKSGQYFYYSSFNGEGWDSKGQLNGMCGVIRVVDPNGTTTTSSSTTTTTAPPNLGTTPTTAAPATPGTTAPASAVPSATHAPTPAAPTPTTTAPPNPKDKKAKDGASSTTTAPPVNGPVDLPAEAIVPNVTPNGTATQDGVVQPSSTPTGDATAVIKQKHGHGSVILLIVSGLGIGGLGIGTAVYKWANRSSKYFPA